MVAAANVGDADSPAPAPAEKTMLFALVSAERSGAPLGGHRRWPGPPLPPPRGAGEPGRSLYAALPLSLVVSASCCASWASRASASSWTHLRTVCAVSVIAAVSPSAHPAM